MTEPLFELDSEGYNDGKPYLIQFKGKGDDYCAQMEPLKEQLKEELGVEIRCFEVRGGTRYLLVLICKLIASVASAVLAASGLVQLKESRTFTAPRSRQVWWCTILLQQAITTLHLRCNDICQPQGLGCV